MIDEEKRIGVRPTAVGTVWQRRSFVVRFVLACVILTVFVVALIPSEYDSTVSLMPPASGSSSQLTGLLSGSTSSDLGSLASGAFGSRSKGALYIAIVNSRTVQDEIINQFGLLKVYHNTYMKDARRNLASRTVAEEATKSGVITLTVTDRDRNRAAAIANAYVQQLNRVSIENNGTSAHLVRVFLEHRLDEINQDLKESTAKLAQFSSKSMTFDTATQGRAMVDAGADLQAKLIASEAELSGLRENYSDINPRVVALRATVTELQKQLNSMGSGTASAGKSGQIYPSLRELPILGATYEDLYRHAKLEETVSDLLTRQYEIAKVEEAKELPVVQVLDPPDVAEKRTSPKRGTIILASVFFYFSVGVFWVLLEAYWKQLDPADPKRMLAAELNGYRRQLLSRRKTDTLRED